MPGVCSSSPRRISRRVFSRRVSEIVESLEFVACARRARGRLTESTDVQVEGVRVGAEWYNSLAGEEVRRKIRSPRELVAYEIEMLGMDARVRSRCWWDARMLAVRVLSRC